MFWDSKRKKMKSDEVLKDVVTSASRPFLEREKPITDLNSLCDRIKALNSCIDQCKRDLDWAECKLKEDNFINISGSIWDLLTKEDTKSINEIIRYRLEAYIAHQRDLIHTCEDELDWLQMKIGIGPIFGKNMFEVGSFNFDPVKDHI